MEKEIKEGKDRRKGKEIMVQRLGVSLREK